MADMQEGRYYHGCGRVTNPSTGATEIVAITGYNNGKTTEIYSLEDNAWRQGPDFPEAAHTVSVVQDGRNSFYAIGGLIQETDPDIYLDTIYRFDEDTYEFVLLEQRLPYQGYGVLGMFVSPSNY